MKKRKVYIAQSIILFCLAFIAYVAYKTNFLTIYEVTVIVYIFFSISIIINLSSIYLAIKKMERTKNVKNRAFFLIGIVSLLLICLLIFVSTKGKSLFNNYINILIIIIGALFVILLVVSVVLLVWKKR